MKENMIKVLNREGKVNEGKVLLFCKDKETEKMYVFSLHPEDSLEIWGGKCPKKSCRVEK